MLAVTRRFFDLEEGRQLAAELCRRPGRLAEATERDQLPRTAHHFQAGGDLRRRVRRPRLPGLEQADARSAGSTQETPKTTRSAGDSAWKVKCVAAPKLPPPPPRHAQNRSGLSFGPARYRVRLRVDEIDRRRLSAESPNGRASNPYPPPSVCPDMPTVGQLPAGSARPRGARNFVDRAERRARPDPDPVGRRHRS